MNPETTNNIVVSGFKKHQRDHITPHKISLLILIKEFIMVKSKNSSLTNPWEQTNQQMRNFSISMLKLIQTLDLDLQELDNVIQPILHPQTYQLFMQRLKDIEDQGVYSFIDYMSTIEGLMLSDQNNSPALIYRSSIVGLFLRRMVLAFDKLGFNHVISLFDQFRNYIKHFSQGTQSKASGNEILDPHEIASQKQAEYFIAQQSALLSLNEKEALSPFELQEQLGRLVKGNPNMAEAHYVSYLNCMRVKEFCGALENLLHYYDRSHFDPKGPEDSSRGFRFAAFNLSILHSQFKHVNESMAALKESIKLAQDANDNVCLQHAMSLLHQYSPDNPDMLLEKSIAKSTDLNMWYLASLCIITLANMRASTKALPSQVFEILTRSDILNCQHSMTELMGTAYCQKVALWNLYGYSSLGSLLSQVLLYLNITEYIMGGTYQHGQGSSSSLCNLALYFKDAGYHKEALKILDHCTTLFPQHARLSHSLYLSQAHIHFTSCLYRGRWEEAQNYVNQLYAVNELEADYYKAVLLVHRGNSPEAYVLVKSLLNKVDVKIQLMVKVLLLESQIFCLSSNPSQAMGPLSKCLSLSRAHYLHFFQNLVLMHMAGLQFRLNLPHMALQSLDQAMVTLLAQGSEFDKGCAHFLYAKCLKKLLIDTPEVTLEPSMVETTHDLFDKALASFEKIDAPNRVKDVLYWQALFYDGLGLKDKRNEVSLKFKHLDQQLPNFNGSPIFVP